MNLPESSYTSTKIRPALTESHKIRRLKWTIQFWIFLDNAKKIYRKTLILLKKWTDYLTLDELELFNKCFDEDTDEWAQAAIAITEQQQQPRRAV